MSLTGREAAEFIRGFVPPFKFRPDMQAPTTSSIADRTVGELVTEDYRLGTVFKRYGIDFCCGGGRTVASACEGAGISLSELEAALRQPPRTAEVQGARNAREWPLDFLADYITNVHHTYVRRTMPILIAFSSKVARVHGSANPELHEIDALLTTLAGELSSHLEDEETILFPYVEQLVAAQAQGIRPSVPDFASASHPIEGMVGEHETAGSLLQRVRTLSKDFQPPPHACNTYKSLFATLEEFEEDLHQHVHLENNILFPRALELEETLLAA